MPMFVKCPSAGPLPNYSIVYTKQYSSMTTKPAIHKWDYTNKLQKNLDLLKTFIEDVKEFKVNKSNNSYVKKNIINLKSDLINPKVTRIVEILSYMNFDNNGNIRYFSTQEVNTIINNSPNNVNNLSDVEYEKKLIRYMKDIYFPNVSNENFIKFVYKNLFMIDIDSIVISSSLSNISLLLTTLESVIQNIFESFVTESNVYYNNLNKSYLNIQSYFDNKVNLISSQNKLSQYYNLTTNYLNSIDSSIKSLSYYSLIDKIRTENNFNEGSNFITYIEIERTTLNAREVQTRIIDILIELYNIMVTHVHIFDDNIYNHTLRSDIPFNGNQTIKIKNITNRIVNADSLKLTEDLYFYSKKNSQITSDDINQIIVRLNNYISFHYHNFTDLRYHVSGDIRSADPNALKLTTLKSSSKLGY